MDPCSGSSAVTLATSVCLVGKLRPQGSDRERHSIPKGRHVLQLWVQKPQPEANSQLHRTVSQELLSLQMVVRHSADTGDSEDQKKITEGSPVLSKPRSGTICYGQG